MGGKHIIVKYPHAVTGILKPRTVQPREIRWGVPRGGPVDPCWLLRAWDVDRGREVELHLEQCLFEPHWQAAEGLTA